MATVGVAMPDGIDHYSAELLRKNFSKRPEDKLQRHELDVSARYSVSWLIVSASTGCNHVDICTPTHIRNRHVRYANCSTSGPCVHLSPQRSGPALSNMVELWNARGAKLWLHNNQLPILPLLQLAQIALVRQSQLLGPLQLRALKLGSTNMRLQISEI